MLAKFCSLMGNHLLANTKSPKSTSSTCAFGGMKKGFLFEISGEQSTEKDMRSTSSKREHRVVALVEPLLSAGTRRRRYHF